MVVSVSEAWRSVFMFMLAYADRAGNETGPELDGPNIWRWAFVGLLFLIGECLIIWYSFELTAELEKRNSRKSQGGKP